MRMSGRIKNTTKNYVSSLLMQITKLVLKFVSRSVFIKYFGIEYVGLDSVFSGILTMLSLSELGIGIAIIYDMYKPIAQNDYEKIKSLVGFYKVIYSFIGFTILVLGLGVIPIIKYVVKLPENININMYHVYVLLLINNCITYFYAYKRAVLAGYQQTYVENKIRIIFVLILTVLQILSIVLTKNYYVYLVLILVSTLMENIVISKTVDKNYKFIKEPYSKLRINEKKQIFENTGYIFLNKMSGTIANGATSVLISVFCGILLVGQYDNYVLFISGLSTLIGYFFTSMTPSLGNMIALENSDTVFQTFKRVRFIVDFGNGIVAVCLSCLLNDFMTIWVGKTNLLSNTEMIILVCINYLTNNGNFIRIYKNCGGIFKDYCWIYLAEPITKIALALLLIPRLGLIGVFLASICGFLFLFIGEPLVVYKKIFKKDVREYYINYCLNILKILISVCLIMFLTSAVVLEGLLGFIIKLFICFLTSIGIFVLLERKSDYYNYYMRLLKQYKSMMFESMQKGKKEY